MRAISLEEIQRALGGDLHGDGTIRISAIAPLESAGPQDIAYLGDARLLPKLMQSGAGCVIVAPAHKDEACRRGACLVSPNPQLYFARLTSWWVQEQGLKNPPGIHPSAVVDPTAEIDPTASVGALSVIEAGVRIGPHTRIASRVTIERNSVIGARCIIFSGAVIGREGFGFAMDGKRWVRIEQLGGVRIGDDVEVGANSCVDRGALGDTVLADGVKLDNQIQIGHNVRVGENTAMASCVGISGSAIIGANCIIAGGVGMTGHVEIVDNTHISGATNISRSISKPGRYTGVYPFDTHENWEHNAAVVRQLRRMRDRIRALEKELATVQEKLPPEQPQ